MSQGMFRRYGSVAAIAPGFALACSTSLQASAAPGKPPTEPVATAAPQLGARGVDLAGMDTAVKPGDDFYRYVNGTWHDKAEIPADRKAVGPASTLQDLAFAQARRWKPRDAYLDQLLKRDFHPPGNVRPRTVRNIDVWFTAFNVQPDDILYLAPRDRVQPW